MTHLLDARVWLDSATPSGGWVAVQPLVDEPGNVAFWEPDTFKVGDRVRVRLSGECDITGPVPAGGAAFHDGLELYLTIGGHPRECDGFVGVVTPCRPEFVCQFAGGSHHLYVTGPGPDGAIYGGHFAAAELEPLEPDR